MKTLDEFINDTSLFKSQYIKYPGLSVYLRRHSQRVNGKVYLEVITIANIIAKKPGKHRLRALIDDLIKRKKSVYVENVLSVWLQEKLIEYGFIRIDQYNFFKEAE